MHCVSVITHSEVFSVCGRLDGTNRQGARSIREV